MSNISIVNDFSGGMANDIQNGVYGEFSVAKNYDTLTYSNRLFPLPSTQALNGTSGVQNIIIGSDGIVYGSGVNAGASGQGSIWKIVGTTWMELSNSRSGINLDYSTLVEYKENAAARTLLYSTATGIYAIDPSNGIGGAAHALAHVTMTQGYVHPADNVLYIAYTVSGGGTYVATNNAGSWTDVALTLPKKYTPTSITKYGNYLAIACTIYASGVIPGANVDTSVVFLWDRDTTHTWTEEIVWGDNVLQIVNNLDGVLIGISSWYTNLHSGLLIKGYSGGEPQVIKEVLSTQTSASSVINPNVNFLNLNRLYFSIDINGTANNPIYKGLWSIGKNKQGRWAVNLEYVPSVNGTSVSVLAAVFLYGVLYCIHTAAGTGTVAFSGYTKSTDYTNASIWESCVNPHMGINRYTRTHPFLKKQLVSVSCIFDPLQTSGQVVVKYRVDATQGGAWTIIFTKTPTSPDTNLVVYESSTATGGVNFTSGRNYEFRIESTGGANILALIYTYEILHTNI